MSIVPHHLRGIWPAVLILAATTLSAEWWGGIGHSDAYRIVVQVWAAAVVGLLFLGWVTDTANLTWHGAWLSTGFWAVQLCDITLLARSGQQELNVVAVLQALAMLSLSLAVWIIMRLEGLSVHWWIPAARRNTQA